MSTAPSSPAADDRYDVSVVLPVFLRKAGETERRFLDRALASVFDQDYPGRFEVIVVDDGSPVAVENCADSLRDGRRPELRWLRSPRNGGLVDALNRGLAAARFPLIARIDADDAWAPGKIARQIESFARDPDLSIVATGMSMLDEAGRAIDEQIRPGDWAGVLRFFRDVGCPFPHGSVLARRDVYRRMGGYNASPQARHAEDFELWGRWLRFFKPAMIEAPLYLYTVSPTSVSVNHAAQQRKTSRRVHERFCARVQPERLPQAIEQTARALGLSVLAAGFVASRLWDQPLTVALPEAAIEPLRQVLADRDLRVLGPAHADTPAVSSLLPTSLRSPIPTDAALRVCALP